MFRNIGFRRQLSVVFSAGILLLALVTAIVVSNVSTQTMRERILNEGRQLAEALAEASKLALLYGSEQNAEDAVKMLSAFEDVVGVAVIQRDMSLLYQHGEPGSTKIKEALSYGTLIDIVDEPELWQFTAPVKIIHDMSEDPNPEARHEVEILGFVKILMSKRSLREMASRIFFYNLLVSLGLAAVLLIILMLIARRLLNPINHLARVMAAAEQGDRVQQVEVLGPPDIREMFHAFNTMLDIIERRERELQKSRDEAMELAQLKGEFAANVSHELRTPMNGVLGMLEMLEDSALSGKEREYLIVARNSAKSLLSLINDILDFSKNEAGKTVLETENFDLYDQIEEIVALLGTQTQKKKIEFAYVLEHELRRRYIGDANRLRQLLINLVSNAIKFTEKGTVSIEVARAQAVPADNKIKLRFAISDTGIGIPLEKQKHIFEAFSQADGSTTRKFGGTGLGLSICKQLVELMGGEINVESTPGEGSCFWFTVELEEQTQKTDKKAADTSLEDHKLNVLLVQRNDKVQTSLCAMLARSKLDCVIVQTHEEADNALTLAGAGNKPINLLVLDENIGETTLQALFSKARQLNTNAICVVLSFAVRDFNVEDNRLVYLAKPVLYRHLMLAVKAAMSGKGVADFDEQQQAKAQKRETELTFPGVNILVVDDNPVNQLVAVGLLKPLECVADTALNGIDCLAKLRDKSYDVILMDCNMPEMDGYKASQKIRAEETGDEHVIIIAITANAGPGDRQKCIASGMDDYLVKPFNREDLRAKLARWVPAQKLRKPPAAKD